MKHTYDSNLKIIHELEKAVEQEIALLNCLNVVYTSALTFLENKNYDDFFSKIEDQQIIENAVNEVKEQIDSFIEKSGCKEELSKIFNSGLDEIVFPPHLKKLANDVSASKKILTSCKILNEKLSFYAKEAHDELREKITSIRNKKIINNGYNAGQSQKSEIIIDC